MNQMNFSTYDPIAQWYDAFVRDESHAGNFGLPYLFALMGDVHGKPICDLACGQGRIARDLARRGAQVVSVDISAELLAIAQCIADQIGAGL